MILPRTIALPGGSFFLGAVPQDKYVNTTELPRRFVEVAPFAMGVHPVTHREWSAYSGDGLGDPDLPVTDVSLSEIADYLAWLNLKTGGGWRLPTEIEWEFACRAGSETIFSSGDTLDPDQANFLFDESIDRVGPGRLKPVGSYSPNSWGLHDMHGNANEWTASPWTRNHEIDAEVVSGFYTIRGGSWDALPRLLRASWRDRVAEDKSCDNLGFRVVRDSG